MPLPLLQSREIFPITGSLPREPFRAFGHDYMGVQTTVNSIDEALLDHDINGGWNGPVWASLYPYRLGITGATYTRDETTQDSEIAHIASGTAVTLEWGLPPTQWALQATQRVIVIKCSDGSVKYTGTVIGNTSIGASVSSWTQNIGVIANGNYVAWVHVESIPAVQTLPPDYYTATGYSAIPDKFQYEENGETFVWDWLHDVGIRPTDQSQIALDGETDMYLSYNLLKESGGLQARSAWTNYITIQGTQDSEWSALQFVVGAGTWSQGNAVPAPGAALLMSDGAGGSTAISFDCRARNVLCSWNDNDTTVRIAGTMATRSGPALAYWELHADNTSTLLASHMPEVVTNHVCAFASLHYVAADIWIDSDDEAFVLTTGFLYRVDPTVNDITLRFIGVPFYMEGHPGGRTLRRPDGGALTFFDYLFKDNQPGVYYNRLQIQSDKRYTAEGVAFFDDCNADLFQGKLYSYRQTGTLYNIDGSINSDVKRTFEYLVYDQWTDTGIVSFDADKYNWQRLRTLRSAKTGMKVLSSGRRHDVLQPIWAVATDKQFREAYSQYYTRRMAQARQASGFDEIYAAAYTIGTGGVFDWKLVSFSGDLIKVCLVWSDITSSMNATVADFTAAGIDTAKLPTYLLWHSLESAFGGGVWIQTNTLPTSGTYLTKSITAGLVEYTGTLPYESGTWCNICFTAYDDGGTGNDAIEPDACCSDADCASILFPPVSGCAHAFESICMSLPANVAPIYSIQVSDVNDFVTRLSRKLDVIAQTVPNLWARVDSAAAADDLSSYTIRIPWNRKELLPIAANVKVDICVLMPGCYETVKAPVLEIR